MNITAILRLAQRLDIKCDYYSNNKVFAIQGERIESEKEAVGAICKQAIDNGVAVPVVLSATKMYDSEVKPRLKVVEG